MFYEVFIPSAEAEGFDVTITVEADNWMVALKSGLARTGEEGADIRNVMCDLRADNSIHVTDALTRRVFVLKEVEDESNEVVVPPEELLTEAPPTRPMTSVSGAQDVVAPHVPEPEPLAEPKNISKQEPVVVPQVPELPEVDRAPMSEPTLVVASAPESDMEEHSYVDATGEVRIGSATYATVSVDEPQARVVRERREKTGQREVVHVERVQESVSENILEDIFLEIQVIHENSMEMEEVVNFVVDMAMEKIPAQGGAILFADVSGKELYFATARGPKSDEIMDFRVPMGKGISGFCAREGVSLAISDTEHDPRFYRIISEALDFDTTSVVCAPIQFEGRVYGCIELINRIGASAFSTNEVNAMTYIGNQFAQYINRLIMSRERI